MESIGEHFAGLALGNRAEAVRLITMDQYPRIELRDPVWDELLAACAKIIREFAAQEYLGAYTHVMIMEKAMQRLKARVPKPWVPTIRTLRAFANVPAKKDKW